MLHHCAAQALNLKVNHAVTYNPTVKADICIKFNRDYEVSRALRLSVPFSMKAAAAWNSLTVLLYQTASCKCVGL